MNNEDKKKKLIKYFVNGEEEITDENELSVEQILDKAGFQPTNEYTLKSDDPKHDYESNYEAIIKIHPNQRFNVLHKGPTPTSQVD